jgi:hypothetical protein
MKKSNNLAPRGFKPWLCAAILAGLWLKCLYPGAFAASSALVESGRPQAAIVLGAHATPVEHFAGEELQAYVARITGVQLPVLTAGQTVATAPANEIVIGRPETNPRLAQLCRQTGLLLDTNTLGDDGYIVKSVNTGTNTTLILSGSNDRSCLFAVYQLLETYGVRFYGYRSRNGEIVPKHASLVLAPLAITEKSHMKFRFVSDNGYAASDRAKLVDVADWAAKNRCNVFMLTPSHAGESWSQIDLAEVRKRGLLIAGPGHILARLTPDQSLFKTHPEYFPLIKGKRSPAYSKEWGGATSFCYSNTNAMQTVVNNTVNYFKENPFIDLLAIYPPDGSQHGVQCQCDQCATLTMSDWYLTLLNHIDAALRTLPSHPKLMWISYNECSVPPRAVKPLDRGRDFILVWCNELRDLGQPMDSEANRHAPTLLRWKPRLVEIKTNWKKNPTDKDLAAWYRWQHWNEYLKAGNYAGAVTVLDYYNEHVAKSVHVPMLNYYQSGPWPDNLMQKDFQFYDSQGIAGWQNCTDYYNDRPNSYWNWLGAQMMWNPGADMGALNRDFYGQMYGPASEVLQKYFAALWDEMASPDLTLAGRGRVRALDHYLKDADALAAADAEATQRLATVHAFQDHCLQVKQEIAESYNPDGSPRKQAPAR